MNSNLHISLNKRWMGNLLGLLVILSMMLSTMAAAPMAPTQQSETPTAPTTAPTTADTSTATPPAAATATQASNPTDTAAAPVVTETSPAATDTAPAATETSPAATETSPAATETVPAATETTVPTVQPTPTIPAPKQPAKAQNSAEASRVNYHKIVVKFKTSTQPQVGSQTTANPPTSAAVLNGLSVKPLFPGAGSSTSKSQVGAQAQAAAPVTNLSTYSIIQLPADTSYDAALQILKGLQSSDDVELAYMEPIYKPADITTQPYLDTQANANGIDAVDANQMSGGKGDNVRVTDIEGGWQIGHEDLPISSSSLIESNNSSDPTWVSHGTAVLGIIAAQGVSNSNISPAVIDGIAPHAELHMVSALTMDTATAIYVAAQNSRPGDIILIPMDAQGPVSGDPIPTGCDGSQFEFIPVEYWQANFDAINAATDAGIIVIEAAGDGSMNLDDTITPDHTKQIYGNAFKRSSRDSGAIIVGAGSATDRSALCFSNFGSRVDVQGWGDNIATTGGDGSLYDGGGDPNQIYTDDFGGTSGAAAMVAGAAASLQGIYKYLSGTPISASDMRKLLVRTGAPQPTDTVNTPPHIIGPLPNLQQASKQVSIPTLLAPVDKDTVFTLRPTLDWTSYLHATSFDIQVDSVGPSYGHLVLNKTVSGTEITLSSDLSSSHQYWWHVRARITITTLDPITNNHTTTTTLTKWSDTSTFTVGAQADTAVAPSLQGPADKSTSIEDGSGNFSPIFSWKDPSNKTNLFEYQVQVSTSYIFAATDTNLGIDTPPTFSILYDPSSETIAGITDSSSNPITLSNKDATYYWHVASCYTSSSGEYCSPWSSRRIIYTGLPAPDGLNEGGNQELRPSFSWNAVDGATAYYLQVAQQNTTKTPPTYKVLTFATIGLPKGQTVVPTTYTLIKDLPKNQTNLYFRVAVKGKTVWTYSDYAAANDTGAPPASVTLVGPKSKSADFTFTPTFSWKPTKVSTDTYNIQISNTSDFEADDHPNNIYTMEKDDIADPTLTTPVTYTFATPLNPQTIYYWHVQSNAGGVLSDWSATSVLYTTVPAPANPSVPLDGFGYVDSLRPTFDWDTVDLASSYQIEVASDAAYAHLLANVITKSGPPFQLPVTLLSRRSSSNLPPNPLYWRVRADGLYGTLGWSDWTEGGSFNTPSAPPTLSSPTNGAILANFNPTLSWIALPKYTNSNSVLNPAGYDVQISTSPNFDTFVFDSTSLGGPATTIAKYPVGNILTDADQYYWRVRAENATDDGVSAWSQPFSFYTPAIVSGTVYDINGSTIQGASVQIGGMTLSATTDSSGNYQFFGLPGGHTYRLYASATGSAPNGYIRQAYNVTTTNGQDSTLNFNLVPVPAAGNMKIVLTWESGPNNLEANLWTPLNNPYLVNEETGHTGSLTADPFAKMDTPPVSGIEVPITLGYGPEAITLKEKSNPSKTLPYVMPYNGNYTYAVHINSSPGTFGQAKAVVVVYDGPDITYMQVFNVPTTSSARWWKVFTIAGNTRKITTVNQLLTYNPQPYVAP